MQEDVYAATGAYRTFRVLMALAAAFDLDIRQLDAVNAFINAHLDETVYIKAPTGFYPKGTTLRLLRALYGLKRAPLLWNKDLSATLVKMGFQRVSEDQCLYIHPTSCIIIFFYVDDILFLNPKQSAEHAQNVIKELQEHYEIRDLGEAKWFLNIRITRRRYERKLWISQDAYIDKIATRFGLDTYSR